MTDEAYVFNETNRERAIVRRSAAHKKGGSRSKYCGLEVDRMSQREIAKKHGPVMMWNMNDFYTWEEFKLMPSDIKVEWLNRMINKYNISMSDVSREVFNMTQDTLGNYLGRVGLSDQIQKVRGKKVKPEDIDRFRSDIHFFWEGPKEDADAKQDVEAESAISDHGMEDMSAIEDVGEEFVEEFPEKDDDSEPIPLTMAFSTCYISNGIDLSMIPGIAAMFEGKMVRVSFEVSIL